MRVKLPLSNAQIGYSNPQLSPARTLNMYAEPIPGTNDIAMRQFPGTKVAVTNGSANNTRALISENGKLIAVQESSLLVYDSALVGVNQGALNTSAGNVGYTIGNNSKLLLVDNVNGYVFDAATNTFTQISDVDFPAQPIDCDYLDGHYLVAQGSTNRFYLSDFKDPLTYSALNYAELETGGGGLRAIRVISGRIFIMSEFYTEVFYPSPNVEIFPFIRDNNLTLQYGCASAGSVARGTIEINNQKPINVLCWLATRPGGPPFVVATDGGQPTKISTPELEEELQGYVNYEDSCAYILTINGHTFYMLNFTEEGKTYAYDFTMQRWHRQALLNYGNYFACSHVFYNNAHYLGHYNTGQISELSNNYYRNADEKIHCMHVLPTFYTERSPRFNFKRFELDVLQGLGSESELGDEDPLIYLSVSHDGGVTFEGSVSQSTGKVGQYAILTAWNQLGTFRDATLKIETFSAISNTLLRAFADIEPVGY